MSRPSPNEEARIKLGGVLSEKQTRRQLLLDNPQDWNFSFAPKFSKYDLEWFETSYNKILNFFISGKVCLIQPNGKQNRMILLF